MAIAKKKVKLKTKAVSMPKAKTKAKPVTSVTKVNVKDFVASIKNETRRNDAKTLLKFFAKVSGWKSRMWGPTIIGFGVYHYTYESGRSGTSPVIGFSPRDANLVIYVFDFETKAALLKKLGKHKGGIKQCLYINKLADVDLTVLGDILEGGIDKANQVWPITAK